MRPPQDLSDDLVERMRVLLNTLAGESLKEEHALRAAMEVIALADELSAADSHLPRTRATLVLASTTEELQHQPTDAELLKSGIWSEEHLITLGRMVEKSAGNEAVKPARVSCAALRFHGERVPQGVPVDVGPPGEGRDRRVVLLERVRGPHHRPACKQRTRRRQRVRLGERHHRTRRRRTAPDSLAPAARARGVARTARRAEGARAGRATPRGRRSPGSPRPAGRSPPSGAARGHRSTQPARGRPERRTSRLRANSPHYSPFRRGPLDQVLGRFRTSRASTRLQRDTRSWRVTPPLRPRPKSPPSRGPGR